MKYKIIIFYVVLYVFVGVFSLNLNFIEGDDAATVMYHLMGRNSEFQPPYSLYHSMFDKLLSFFDSKNESLLRVFSIGISFVFGFLSMVSLTFLMFYRFGNNNKSIFWILIGLPFLIPEILFNSLIVNPPLISITFLFIAHLFLLKYLNEITKIKYLIISIILFGLGVSFRWSNGFYIFVLLAEFILVETDKFIKILSLKRVKKSILIFPLFIFSIVFWIYISGYSLIDVYTTFQSGTGYIENTEISYLSMLASSVAFLTPSFLILFIIGLYFSIKKKKYKDLGLLILSLIPYFYVGLYPSYKYMINLVFVFVIFMAFGLENIKNYKMKLLLFLIVSVPWILGIQLKLNSAWGPGFEVSIKHNGSIKKEEFNPDSYIALERIAINLGTGSAIPTPEGPRPIYGYFDALFNKWNQFVVNNNKERVDAVNYAIESKCGLIQDVKHSYISSKLIELGFNTEDAFRNKKDDVFERKFVQNKNEVIVHVFRNKRDLFNKELIHKLDSISKIVIYSSYSNIISKLQNELKDDFEQKGVYWGVINKSYE